MATSLTQHEESKTAVHTTVETEVGGGLTANPDALLAVFDSIEKSVAGNAGPEEFVKKSPRVCVVFHNSPRH